MLECRDLRYRHSGGDHTIGADFSLEAGQGVALMGPSGVGKTTILNLIAGFLTPQSGEIALDGVSLLPMAPASRPLTYLFQSHNLFPHLNVWENIALGMDPGLRIDSAGRGSIRTALGRVGLDGMERRLPTSLSGGQQQRVGLARCLVRRRPVLLLDEPFSALDRELRDDIAALILELQQELRLRLVVSTHQPDDAAALHARIIRLEGRPGD